MNTVALFDSLWRDLRYGARLLRLNPGFASVAILSLALGIGANAAIFQLLNALRIRSLPVSEPQQLAEVRIVQNRGKSGWFSGEHPELTNPLWERLRDRQQAFSGVFAWASNDFELSPSGESRRAQGAWVSGRFFDTLGVRPVLGRLLADADDHRGCGAPPAVIGYGFWQREFGGGTSAIGRTLTLDGHGYEIAGVMPPGFSGIEVGRGLDVAIPLCAEPYSRGTRTALDRNNAWFLGVIGRLKPGWSFERATAHFDALSSSLFKETLPIYRAEEEKTYLGFRLGAFAAGTGVSNLRDAYESPLWMLLGIAALVLLIACANLANLMLARATARAREIAVRLALGASRMRIVRQLLAESLLLAAAGAAAAALLARWLAPALVASLTTEHDPVVVDVVGDWRVFGFIALLAATASLVFGVLPALRATVASPGAAMKSGGRGSTDGERSRLRRGLVVAQVAVSLVLVVVALLFVRSFQNLATVDVGFTRRNLLIAHVTVRSDGVSDEQLRLRHATLLERLRHTPGVVDAAQVRNVPIGDSFSNRNVIVSGVERTENVNYNSISNGYFSTLASPLLGGRDFDRRDAAGAPRVAIVTESFGRVFFPGSNPIGRTFQIAEAPGKPRPSIEIVGVARDSKYSEVRERFEPLIFVPIAQDDLAAPFARIIVRSAVEPGSLTAPVLALVRDVHPISVTTLRTMQSQMDDSLRRERLVATLSALFGGLAALIAALGLYGVLSYMVARRRSEIGVRMALGAARSDVVRMVMREAGILLAVGLALGAVGSVAAARLAMSLLFGLQPYDPATLAMAIGGLSAIAALASYIPAWRASRVEPTLALREE